MKPVRVLSFLFLLASAFSCNKENYAAKTLTVTQVAGHTESVSTKASLSEDGAIVQWSPKDTINVLVAGKSEKFTLVNESPVESGVFTGSLSVTLTGMDVYSTVLFCGAYPYSENTVQDNSSITIPIPSGQLAVPGSFDPKAFPSLACSSSSTMIFYNVCGGICFTLSQSGIESISLSGENKEPLAGKTKFGFDLSLIPSIFEAVEPATQVKLSAKSGETLQTDVWYYISVLPQEFKNGFSLTFNKQGKSTTKTVSTPVTITRSAFLSYENIDSGLVF